MGFYIYKRKKNMIGFTSLILKKDKVPFRSGDIVYITDSNDILHSRWRVVLENNSAIKLKKEPERTTSLEYKKLINAKDKRIYEISSEEELKISKYFIHKLNIFPFYDIKVDNKELSTILNGLRDRDFDYELYINVNTNREGLFEKYNLIISKNYGVIVFKCFDSDLFTDAELMKDFIDDINSDSIYKTLCSSSFISDNGTSLNINYSRFYIFESNSSERYTMINSKLNSNNMVCNSDMFFERLKELNAKSTEENVTKDIHFGILQMLIPQYTNSKIENVVLNKLKFMPEQSYELDDIQKEILAKLDQRSYLKAAAGSGKTILLLAKAYELASANPDKIFMIICYNSKLAEDIRILSANTGKIRANLRISTLDKFIEDKYSQYEDPDSTKKFEYRRREFVNKVSTGKIVERYGGIFIDEMQQLSEEYIAAFLELLDDNKYMVIAGDYYQQISSAADDYDIDEDDETDDSVSDDFYIGNYDFKKIMMERNYRNTEQIAKVTNKMVSRINDYVDILKIPYLEEHKTIISGKSKLKSDYVPRYYDISDQNQEIQLVINIIRDLLVKEHFVQNDILILTPWDNSKFHKNYVIYKVEESLRKSGIQFCDFTDSKLTKDGIRIGTIGKSIGLDFKAVIICGMNMMKETKDKIKISTIRDLLEQDNKTKREFIKYLKNIYVACSRAREVLIVIDDFNKTKNTNLISQFLKLVGEDNERK